MVSSKQEKQLEDVRVAEIETKYINMSILHLFALMLMYRRTVHISLSKLHSQEQQRYTKIG